MPSQQNLREQWTMLQSPDNLETKFSLMEIMTCGAVWTGLCGFRFRLLSWLHLRPRNIMASTAGHVPQCSRLRILLPDGMQNTVPKSG